MMNGGAAPKASAGKPKPEKPAGRQLLCALDPALNLQVGRLWNMDASMEENLISDSIDFFQSLDTYMHPDILQPIQLTPIYVSSNMYKT